MVIKTIYHLITNYYDSVPGKNKDDIVVLLCAPTGKAAFLINGMTLHATFHLLISQVADKMTHLSADNSTEIRSHLLNAKLLIIDEISMVGAYTFNNVNNRLQEIMKVEATFGGLSVICVGDLNQLPPVCEPAIFKPPCKFQGLAMLLINNPVWEEFKYFELNEVMRQKNDIPLISALNNLASNCLTDNDYSISKHFIKSILNTDVYFERIDDIDIITNPTSYLDCDHMSLFQSIVKVYTDFKPQETYLIQIQGCKNIQILFQADKISTGVEHWISSYYDGCTVHIYDSLNKIFFAKTR